VALEQRLPVGLVDEVAVLEHLFVSSAGATGGCAESLRPRLLAWWMARLYVHRSLPIVAGGVGGGSEGFGLGECGWSWHEGPRVCPHMSGKLGVLSWDLSWNQDICPGMCPGIFFWANFGAPAFGLV
jgi:hypothetical protein